MPAKSKNKSTELLKEINNYLFLLEEDALSEETRGEIYQFLLNFADKEKMKEFIVDNKKLTRLSIECQRIQENRPLRLHDNQRNNKFDSIFIELILKIIDAHIEYANKENEDNIITFTIPSNALTLEDLQKLEVQNLPTEKQPLKNNIINLSPINSASSSSLSGGNSTPSSANTSPHNMIPNSTSAASSQKNSDLTSSNASKGTSPKKKPDTELDALKKDIKKSLQDYYNSSISSIFGIFRHHKERARCVEKAINACESLEEIKFVLLSQRNLFEKMPFNARNRDHHFKNENDLKGEKWNAYKTLSDWKCKNVFGKAIERNFLTTLENENKGAFYKIIDDKLKAVERQLAKTGKNVESESLADKNQGPGIRV